MASRVFSLVVFALLLASALGPARAQEGPRDIVSRLNETLIGVMRQAEALGYEGRYERLAPVLEGTFDFPRMAQISVGRHWRELDQGQRERLTAIFGRMSIATFAARFDGYSGERFNILGEERAPRQAVLVRNQLIKSDGDAIEINYLLREREGAWRVLDIFLDAKYSEMAMKRSEYSSVIKAKGFEGLIQALEAKIAELATRKGG
ncbi:MAG: ABC transporter substrate-binding protein [Kiloniellales bacterium]